MSENSARYPDEQKEYCQSVGRLLPNIVGLALRDLGFKVWVNPDQSNGVDLKLFDKEDSLVLVAEIINWSSFSEMSKNRKTCIITNLSEYDCRRVFIYTALKNEGILDDFYTYGIFLLRIGYQVLTKPYYEHYAKKNQVIHREIDSEEIRKDIRSKIANFLSFIGILNIPNMLNNEIVVTDFVT
jgi:hypothetical protein